MLESCRLEQSSSAAAPVLGCKVLCQSGEPFPRMSPSLLNTGLALTEGSISSSPHETGSGACQGQAVLLDHSTGPVSHPSSCMKALGTPQLLPASHPESVLNSHSMQDTPGLENTYTLSSCPAPWGLLAFQPSVCAFFATGVSKVHFRKNT